MTLHKFRDILEHDIDMLILEEFSCSESFCKIFLDKVEIKGAKLLMTWQSKTDSELGESDITIIFERQGKKFALLIEDKIDAVAMPEQPSRYILRGDKGVSNGEYDYYYIFIVAPKQYLENNEKAQEYPNYVSYEEIKEYFERLNDSRSAFKLSQIDLAINKQKNGYQIIKNTAVTDFWQKYVEYSKKYFPNLDLAIHSDIKPANGVWPHFRLNKVGTFIYHKSNMGYVDLTYNRQADKIDSISKFLVSIVGNYYEEGFKVVKTGKSCAIRIEVPIIAFSKPFEEQKNYVSEALSAVDKLHNLSIRLEVAGIYNLFE